METKQNNLAECCYMPYSLGAYSWNQENFDEETKQNEIECVDKGGVH